MTEHLPDVTKYSPDLAARMVIVAAYIYYALDENIQEDNLYDRLSQYVADNFDKLHDDRKWALGSAEEMRSTGVGIKFSIAAVSAAYAQLQQRGIKPLHEFPTVWLDEPGRGRYTTATRATAEVANEQVPNT